jgi:hypothetical protein
VRTRGRANRGPLLGPQLIFWGPEANEQNTQPAILFWMTTGTTGARGPREREDDGGAATLTNWQAVTKRDPALCLPNVSGDGLRRNQRRFEAAKRPSKRDLRRQPHPLVGLPVIDVSKRFTKISKKT